MATYTLRRRIERFYEDSDGCAVWVIFEDTDGNIHYRDIGYDTSRQIMMAQQFYKEYRLSDLQADRGQ